MSKEKFTIIRKARLNRIVNFLRLKPLISLRRTIKSKIALLLISFLLLLLIIITAFGQQSNPNIRNANQKPADKNNPKTTAVSATPDESAPADDTTNKSQADGVKKEEADFHDGVIVKEVYNSQYKTAENSDKREAGLNDIIIVRVENLEELVKRSKCEGDNLPKDCRPKDIVLYINGREISGLEPESGAPKLDTLTDGNENSTGNPKAPTTSSGELRYHLQRITDSPESGRDNSEHWSDLLGLRLDNLSSNQNQLFNFNSWRKRRVEVSVGLAGDYPVKTEVKADAQKSDKQFWLIRLRGGYWIIAWLIIMVVIIGGLIWLAMTSDFLRDRSAVLYDRRKPYSLSAFQAAWWFAIVLLSFIFIWLVTGQNDLSPTALILLGIGLGTTLGAHIIDANKRNTSSNAIGNAQLGSDKLKVLLTEKARLETELNAPGGNTEAKDREYQEKIHEIRIFFPNAIGPCQKGFLLDILSDVNGINFHRFQLFVWTIILGLFFIISALGRLAMPQFSETLLALMGISAGAFLGFKAPENNSLPVPAATPGDGNGGVPPLATPTGSGQTTTLPGTQNNALSSGNTETNNQTDTENNTEQHQIESDDSTTEEN